MAFAMQSIGVMPMPPASNTMGLDFGHVQEEMTSRRFQVQDVAFLDDVGEITGRPRPAAHQVYPAGFFSFDRDAVEIFCCAVDNRRASNNG
jgi:hypothetical protein